MKKVLLGTAGLLASATLMAAAMPVRHSVKANPWYVGVGVNGNSQFLDKTDRNSKLSSHKAGFNVFAGYNFSKYWGNELEYYYIGDRNYKNAATRQKYKTTWAVSYDVLGYLPLIKYVKAFGKVGAEYYAQSHINAHYDSVNGYRTTGRLSTIGMNFGGGLQAIYKQFGARVSYTNFEALMPAANQNNFDPVNLIGFDVMYYFG